MKLSWQDFRSFWLLARPLNLGIAWITLVLSAYLSAIGHWFFWTDANFWFEGLALLAAMVGGYYINDVYDFRIDQVNKPDRALVGSRISRKKVLTAYLVSVAVSLLATVTLPWKFWIVNASALGVLYLYAAYFKRYAVIGNVLVAALTALVVLAGALLYHLKMPLFWGMVFAFEITFVREVCKDVEDMKGDLRFGLQTLPIVIGIGRTRQVLQLSYGILLISTWLPTAFHLVVEGISLERYFIVSLILVQLPLLYCQLLLRGATRPEQFGQQSQMLKLIMAGGLVSLLFLPL